MCTTAKDWYQRMSSDDQRRLCFEGLSGISGTGISQVLDLNEILADVLFPIGLAGEPAHLDLDENAFRLIEQRYNYRRDEFITYLIETVCNVSSSTSPAGVFGVFSEATRRWNNRRAHFNDESLSPPPALGLLAMLSLAAELMRSGSSGDGESQTITASAYYARLKEVVGKESWSVADIQKEYRDRRTRFEVNGKEQSRAEGLWRSLELWLIAWEGERGTCTVSFPEPGRGGRWAVDMPISQALLRDADRESIRRMFGFRNLDPLVPISEEMMFVLLDEWCESYGTSHLKNVWKHADYRESVVGAALNTLMTWSGVPSGDSERSGISAIGVGLTLDLNAFTRRIDLGIEIRTGTAAIPQTLDILDEDGKMVRTSLQPGGPRTARVSDSGTFDPDCLVSGILKVSNAELGLVGRRVPRPIVPFLASSAGNAYAEVSTMTLSARHGVLVRASTDDGHDLLADALDLLERTARPGWSVVDSGRYAGIPTGWVFIQNVELVSYSTLNLTHTHLSALTPLVAESMSLSDGFRIPGRRERWLASSAPSVLAVFPYETSVTLNVIDSMGQVIHSARSDERAAVVKLSDLSLPAGTYRIEAVPQFGMCLTKTVYLVTADTPAPSRFVAKGRLGYPLGESQGFGVLSAEHLEQIPQGTMVVRGLDVRECAGRENPHIRESTERVPTTQQWAQDHDAQPTSVARPVKIERAPAGSCLVNRSHHWILPTADRGPAPKFIQGVCKYCNFVKQLPGRYVAKAEFRRNYQSRVVQVESPTPRSTAILTKESIAAIPPIEAMEDGLWDHAFEAVCYLQTGSIGDLETIVGQVGGGNIGVDRIVRSLTSLGHIDVRLDSYCKPHGWSVSPVVLVVTSATEAHLAGFRSAHLLQSLERQITNVGGKISFLQSTNSPKTVKITAPVDAVLEDLVGEIADPISGKPILVQRQAPEVILQALCGITVISESCPRISRPPSRTLNKWNGSLARWEGAEDDLAAGAYQSIGPGYVYTFHDTDIDIGDEVLSGTPSTVKHRESLRAGKPLIFFSQESKVLSLRLGAELPGLLGRAVVGLSGRAPDEDEVSGRVNYHDVDESIANTVYRLLRS